MKLINALLVLCLGLPMNTTAEAVQQCQRGNTTYNIGDRIRVPGHDACLGVEEVIEAYDACSENGEWKQDDTYIACGVNERCSGAMCLPVMCEYSGELYDIGYLMRLESEDSCSDEFTTHAAYQTCTSQGTWERDDVENQCSASEMCALASDASDVHCVPVQCHDDTTGQVYNHGDRFRLPEEDSYNTHDTVWRAYKVCSDFGEFQMDREYVECDYGLHCNGQGTTLTCVPNQCERDGQMHAIGTRLRVEESDTCPDTNSRRIAYLYCAEHGLWEEQYSQTQCNHEETCELGSILPDPGILYLIAIGLFFFLQDAKPGPVALFWL